MESPLLDRQFLEKLERLTIHWKKSFPGLVGGHNPSRYSGGGQEFLDHRHFHHGDDLRAVNWRAYMRLEKLFLKMFQIEPRTPVRLLLDTSQSMTAPTPEKLLFAKRLAAALCYVGLVRLDTLSIQTFADRLGERLTCGGGRHRFSPVMQWLAARPSGGPSSYLQVAREFLSVHTQPGLVVIVSDFLDETGCERALQYISDFGHELLLIHVWAEEERRPPWRGEVELVDAESGSRMRIEVDDQARDRYTAAFDEYAGTLQTLALRKSGRYIGVSTATAIEDVLFGPVVRAWGLS
ncbi:MAG: DUF58 domain-containing protein [Bryobacterales bacterium]|nr:DUF58 domain-containing protein [Bryobacterales bacterium]